MLYKEFILTNHEDLNTRLYDRFMELVEADRVHETHHFAGRFENTYINKQDIPDIAVILATVRQHAGALLNIEPDRLRAGFWFNAMRPGQLTMPHHHDEDDELLSAVYYIRVPENSGDLVMHDGEREVRVHPVQSKLVMFPPQVLHEVTANNSNEMRLSVAFNIGPVDDD